jgi:hypothetical protein
MLRGTTSIQSNDCTQQLTTISLRGNGRARERSTQPAAFLRHGIQTTSAILFCEGFQSMTFFPFREAIAYYF